MAAPCVIDEGTTIESFESASAWSIDSSTYWYPPEDNSLSLTPGKTSVQFRRKQETSPSWHYAEKTVSLDLSSLYSPAIVLDVWHQSNFMFGTGGSAWLSLDISSTTDYSTCFHYERKLFHPGWSRLMIGPGEWTNIGGESWANTMVRLRIGVKPIVYGCVPLVNCDRLRGGVQNVPSVVIRYDDSYDGVYTYAFGYHTALDLPATFDVVTDSVDMAGYVTLGQIQEMVEAGWELTNYSKAHPVMTELDMGGMRADIEGSMTYLSAHGIVGTPHYAYSRTCVDDRLLRVLDQLGFLSGGIPIGGATTGSTFFAGVPIVEPYMIPTIMVDYSNTLSQVQGWVDAVVASGASLQLYFHDIVSGTPGSGEWSASDLEDLLTYIAAYRTSDGLQVLTISDFVAFASEPVDATIHDRDLMLIESPDTPQDIRCTAGDAIELPMRLVGHDLTGCSLALRVASTTGANLFVRTTGGGGITVSSPGTGDFSVKLAPANTSALRGPYIWQLSLTDAAGDTAIVQSGRLLVAGAIT